MLPHQERIRKANPNMSCDHLWVFKDNSDKAPFINEDGTRTTIKFCVNCGETTLYTRSQKEFESEISRGVSFT